jgi:hypothetical protein
MLEVKLKGLPLWLEASMGKKVNKTLHEKQTKAKRDGGMVQVVECFSSKQ